MAGHILMDTDSYAADYMIGGTEHTWTEKEQKNMFEKTSDMIEWIKSWFHRTIVC